MLGMLMLSPTVFTLEARRLLIRDEEEDEGGGGPGEVGLVPLGPGVATWEGLAAGTGLGGGGCGCCCCCCCCCCCWAGGCWEELPNRACVK
jgi:hypothetical protein